jgi:hypothetical protein
MQLVVFWRQCGLFELFFRFVLIKLELNKVTQLSIDFVGELSLLGELAIEFFYKIEMLILNFVQRGHQGLRYPLANLVDFNFQILVFLTEQLCL